MDFDELRRTGGSFVGTAESMADYWEWRERQVCEGCGARLADAAKALDADGNVVKTWATETLCWPCFRLRCAKKNVSSRRP